MDCEDCRALFKSDEQSVHLRQEDGWWAVDEVDDRGKRYNSTAKFSNFDLAEKYLIWDWGTSIFSGLAAGSLGKDLYEQGYAPEVEVRPESEGIVEVQAGVGGAVLPQVDGTIFSHLMAMSVDELEQLIKACQAAITYDA